MKVFPVVHVNSPEVAAEQADLAFQLGADGVYLIDHNANIGNLFTAFNKVKNQHRAGFVGLNALGAGGIISGLNLLDDAFKKGELEYIPDGLWVDRANLDPEYLDSLSKLRTDHPELGRVKILGGVAFKYTPEYTDEPEAAAAQAKKAGSYIDVITTSGEGTGSPPSVEKIKAMKESTAGQIAIASGVDAGNIASYAPFTDEVLVASSLETYSYSGIFDPVKLKELIDAAHTPVNSSGRNY